MRKDCSRSLRTPPYYWPACLLCLAAMFGCGEAEEPQCSPSIWINETSVRLDERLTPGAPVVLDLRAERGFEGGGLASVRIALREEGTADSGKILLDQSLANSDVFNWDTTLAVGHDGCETETAYVFQISVEDAEGCPAFREHRFSISGKDSVIYGGENPRRFFATFARERPFAATGGERPELLNAEEAGARKAEIDLYYEADTAAQTYSLISPDARSDGSLYEDPLDGFPANTLFYDVEVSAAQYLELKESDKSFLRDVVRQGALSTWPGHPDGARIGWPPETSPFGTVVGFESGERFGLIRVFSTCGTRAVVEILTTD